MEEAKKARKLARFWLTKHTTTLQSALDTTTTTATELRALTDEFNKKVSRLDDAQRTLEVLIPDEELEAHVEEAEQYLSERNKVKYLTIDKIESLSDQGADDNSSIRSAASGDVSPIAMV